MAISFVSNALGGTTTTTSFSITLPATQVDDLIVLEYTHRGTPDATLGGTYSGPAFTEKHDQQYATSTFSGKTLYSRATGNHSGQTVTGSGLTNSCAAIVTVYRGALKSGDPLADATVVGEQNAAANETQAQITTATHRAWVVLVVANAPDVAVTAQTCTSPGTLPARAEVLSTGGLDTSIAHASAEKTIAGATGSLTWAQTDGASGSWAYAIKPEPDLPRSRLPTSLGPFLPPQRGIGSTVLPAPPSAGLVDVPLGTLTLAGFAPVVLTPLTLPIPLGTLVLVGYEPTVLTPRLVAVPLGTLPLVGFAPTVLTPQTVPVPLGTLPLVGYEPVVITAVIVSVPLGTLPLEGFAPTVVTPLTLAMPSGDLPLVGFAPTVTGDPAAPVVVASSLPTRLGPFLPPRRGIGNTGPIDSRVSVPLGTLTLAGFAPTVVATATALIDVPLGTLTLTGFAPTVSINPIYGSKVKPLGPFFLLFRRSTGSAQVPAVSAAALVQPPSGTLTLEGFAPTVLAGTTVAPPSGTLTLTAFAPTVLTPNTVAVPLGTLVLTAFAPTVLTPQLVTPPLGTLVLTGFAPTVSTGTSVAVPLGTLTLTAFAPDVLTPSVGLVLVPAGELPLVGYAPTVLGDSLGAPEGGGGGGPEHFMPMSQSIGLRKKKREDEEPPRVAVEIETAPSQEGVAAAAAAAPVWQPDIARLERTVRKLEETKALLVEVQAAKAELAAARAAIAREEQEALEVLRAILAEDDE